MIYKPMFHNDYPNYSTEVEYLNDLIDRYLNIYFEDRQKFLELKNGVYEQYRWSKFRYSMSVFCIRMYRRYGMNEEADSEKTNEIMENARSSLASSLIHYTAVNYVAGKPYHK